MRFGRTLNDQDMVDEGLRVLDQGIAAYPSFVLFSKLLVYAESPRDAPEFQQSLTAVVDNFDARGEMPTEGGRRKDEVAERRAARRAAAPCFGEIAR